MGRPSHSRAAPKPGEASAASASHAGLARLVARGVSSVGAPVDASMRPALARPIGSLLSEIRIHDDAAAAESAERLGARAYAFGRDIVLGRGVRGAPDAGRHVLAHEIAHVAQQASTSRSVQPALETSDPSDAAELEADRFADAFVGGRVLSAPRTAPRAAISRQGPGRALGDPLGDRAAFVREAIDFVDTLTRALTLDRTLAQQEVDRAGAVLPTGTLRRLRFDQRSLQARLARARGIYEAQRTMADANDPVQGQLRASYARFLHEIRDAFDRSRAWAPRESASLGEEQRQYGESLTQWLEASPMRDAALAGRTAFTAADAAASTQHDTDFDSVVAQMLTHVNLVTPGGAGRARAAILADSNRVAPDAANTQTRSAQTGARFAAAQAAVTNLSQAERTVAGGSAQLAQAITALAAWLAAPQAASPVADRIDELFHTRDPGYGRLILDRLQLMQRELAGTGSLYAHFTRPGAGTCSNPDVLGESPRPYELVFCGRFGALAADVRTLLHELAHAVIPGRGSRQAVTDASEGRPRDRAYPNERLLLRMTTEEALHNAESYASLAAALASPGSATPTTARADTATGCAQPSPLLDALARAEAFNRRADSYGADFAVRGAVEPWARAIVERHFGPLAAEADVLEIFARISTIASEGTFFQIPHTFTCVPAHARCTAGVLAFDAARRYLVGSSPTMTTSVAGTRICPAFFTAARAEQEEVAFAAVVLAHGSSVVPHPEQAHLLLRVGRDIYNQDFPNVPAASLAEHQAADAAVP